MPDVPPKVQLQAPDQHMGTRKGWKATRDAWTRRQRFFNHTMKTIVKTVGMYPAHWQWVQMRAQELGVSATRILRILVELDHRDRFLDKVVIQKPQNTLQNETTGSVSNVGECSTDGRTICGQSEPDTKAGSGDSAGCTPIA